MQSKIFLGLFLLGTVTAIHATNFNFSKIQQGATFKGCYHTPCSVGKVKNFKQLQKSPQQTMIELTMAWGEQDWKAKNPTWFKNTSKIYMSCSLQQPTIAYNGQTDFLPLNPNGVAGILDNNARLYFQTCHGFLGDPADGAKKYGYNIKENYN